MNATVNEAPIPDDLKLREFSLKIFPQRKYITIDKFDPALLISKQLVVHWIGGDYNQFYTGALNKVHKPVSSWWIQFHVDNYQLSFDLNESNYLKTWAFIKLTPPEEASEESQQDQAFDQLIADVESAGALCLPVTRPCYTHLLRTRTTCPYYVPVLRA